MSEISGNSSDYRGYRLDAVQHGAGWRAYIFPGPRFLRTRPDQAAGLTKEEVFAKARVIVDYHLSRGRINPPPGF